MSSFSKHVMILGCGRSGTSIFGELFEHLPAYTYLSEPDFDEILKLDLSRPHAFKVPRESKDFPPKHGLSISLPKLFELFPSNLHIYWKIRHPLDTIASLKVGISKNWGHHPRPHDWEEWKAETLVKKCAYHWSYLNTFGYEQIKDLAKVKRFEDMLADPLDFALTICEEIGIRKEDCFTDIAAWGNRVQNKNNDKFVEAKTSQAYSTKDHTVRVNRWKENLSNEDIEICRPLIEELAAQFSYPLP
ncbi:MAG: hypothetical protein AAF696_18935 [Bacteroidota bacterium]